MNGSEKDSAMKGPISRRRSAGSLAHIMIAHDQNVQKKDQVGMIQERRTHSWTIATRFAFRAVYVQKKDQVGMIQERRTQRGMQNVLQLSMSVVHCLTKMPQQ